MDTAVAVGIARIILGRVQKSILEGTTSIEAADLGFRTRDLKVAVEAARDPDPED